GGSKGDPTQQSGTFGLTVNPPKTAVDRANSKINSLTGAAKTAFNGLSVLDKSLIKNSLSLHPDASVTDLLNFVQNAKFDRKEGDSGSSALNMIATLSAHCALQPDNQIARNTLENFTSGTIDLNFVSDQPALFGEADNL